MNKAMFGVCRKCEKKVLIAKPYTNKYPHTYGNTLNLFFCIMTCKVTPMYITEK